jgi:hypothetical protein
MTYRTVFDVRADDIFAGNAAGLHYLSIAIAWTAVWVVLHRSVQGMPPARRRNGWKGAVVGGVLIAVGVIVVAGTTYPAVRDQRRCREWLRAREYRTATGVVTALRRDAGKYPPWHFRVGATDFTYRGYNARTGGFRGEFTAPGADRLTLRDGLPVRIAHRDGRILRIEVAE